ncbi:MAG: peptidylprolyl isomerase [Candidatus Brocadiaceae bacterium]|nr:peptidylprolyl isomerase [Candidatus Brocadiaceae bacterium]
MAQVKSGDTVQVHYTGKFEDGTVFDSSADREPLQFTIGEGQLIPGFEQAVIGMNPGESKTTTIPADNAYGPRNQEMVFEIDRQQLPGDKEPQIGMLLQMENKHDGRTLAATVTNVTESNVTIDANHPLAGKDLTFDIQLMKIA